MVIGGPLFSIDPNKSSVSLKLCTKTLTFHDLNVDIVKIVPRSMRNVSTGITLLKDDVSVQVEKKDLLDVSVYMEHSRVIARSPFFHNSLQ